MASIGDPLSWTLDSHGEPPGSIEIKLVDYPEAGYYSTNTPNQQGEIWIRGGSVMERYYESAELTAEAIAPGGWFKTGDIGEWDKNGHLKVIDRKKNLVKTLNGEYIALEKVCCHFQLRNCNDWLISCAQLESIYRSASIVANICIYASITETKPVAIIVPAEPALKKLADTMGVQGHGIEDLVHDTRIQSEILKQLQAVGRRAALANIEMIQGVVLSDEEWTPQSVSSLDFAECDETDDLVEHGHGYKQIEPKGDC
jgi:long-chain acyl-CoA synthetase